MSKQAILGTTAAAVVLSAAALVGVGVGTADARPAVCTILERSGWFDISLLGSICAAGSETPTNSPMPTPQTCPIRDRDCMSNTN